MEESNKYITILMENGSIYTIKKEYREVNFKEGSLDLKKIWDKKLPIQTQTSRDIKVLIKDASEQETMRKYFKRGAQIIHPKDIGFIMRHLSINKDMVVGEAGSGSGHATIYLSKVAKEVYSYEINPKHYEITKENLQRFNIKNVKLINKNILEVEEKEKFDMLLFDFKEAPKKESIDKAYELLKPLAPLILYLPVMEQVTEAIKNLNKKFIKTEIHEIIQREWQPSPLRPKFQGIMHTSFIIIAYKNIYIN